MKKATRTVTIRLSTEGKRLLVAMAEASGVTMTAVLELILREKAKREGIR